MRKTVSSFVLLLSFFSLLLCGCGAKAEKKSISLFAMDTFMEITIYSDREVPAAAEDIIRNLERRLSVTDPHSEIYALNKNSCSPLSDDTYLLLSKSGRMCEKTNGALDITVYPIVSAWGFTTSEKQVPSDDDISLLLPLVDYKKLILSGEKDSFYASVSEGMAVDLGSVAKGYVSDVVKEYLLSEKVSAGVINLGGNITVFGKKPDRTSWKVAITNPFNQAETAGYLSIYDSKSVVTSGSYQRSFEENGEIYHHIIDPQTGYPAKNGLVSVTIISDEGFYCDALSTALFVMGLEKASDYWRQNPDFEAVFILEDGSLYITEGIRGSFTPLNGFKSEVIKR